VLHRAMVSPEKNGAHPVNPRPRERGFSVVTDAQVMTNSHGCARQTLGLTVRLKDARPTRKIVLKAKYTH